MESLTEKNSVQSRVLKTELINWRELQFVQNENFKEFEPDAKHKLKSSIIGNNFTTPFYVWEDPSGIRWCLDGKHRTILLEELISEGVQVPYQLPATFIDCPDKKAAAKLVLLFSSQYARVTQEGMFDFLKLNDLDFSELKGEIDIPDFSELRFEQKFSFTEDLQSEDELIDMTEKTIIVKSGDVFRLGKHTLYCGSFMDMAIMNLIPEKARIVFTDPPYNLAANEFSNKGVTEHTDFAMAGGEMSDDEFMLFLQGIMKRCCEYSLPGAIHYICMDWRHVWHMSEAARTVYGSVIPKQLVVWNKTLGANGSFYRAKHELVFIYKNGEEKHLSNIDLKDRTRYNVWDYPNATSFANPDRKELLNHPTPKPVQMVVDAILDTTNEGDVVIDWFMGSGTTLIAAEITNRVAFGTEIEPKYIQSEILRYIKHCEKNGKVPMVEHLNGPLTLEAFKILLEV